MDNAEEFMMTRPPTARRPLLGLIVLVVEDSRFACEAVRLLCLRSGGRIRRMRGETRPRAAFCRSIVLWDNPQRQFT